MYLHKKPGDKIPIVTLNDIYYIENEFLNFMFQHCEQKRIQSLDIFDCFVLVYSLEYLFLLSYWWQSVLCFFHISLMYFINNITFIKN